MVADQALLLFTAAPVPNGTGCVGSLTGASQSVNTGGKGWLFVSKPGLVKVSRPFTVAGASVTVAVAIPPGMAGGVSVSRPPMPLSLGVVPPVQWLVASHTFKPYLLMVKFAVL